MELGGWSRLNFLVALKRKHANNNARHRREKPNSRSESLANANRDDQSALSALSEAPARERRWQARLAGRLSQASRFRSPRTP
jgi:hypothetical protein